MTTIIVRNDEDCITITRTNITGKREAGDRIKLTDDIFLYPIYPLSKSNQLIDFCQFKSVYGVPSELSCEQKIEHLFSDFHEWVVQKYGYRRHHRKVINQFDGFEAIILIDNRLFAFDGESIECPFEIGVKQSHAIGENVKIAYGALYGGASTVRSAEAVLKYGLSVCDKSFTFRLVKNNLI